MKAIIYNRVSSDDQVKGTSLDFQEKTCSKYCKDRNIEIVKIFREGGESAKDFKDKNRVKLLEALEYCRKNKNKIDAFVVLRVDRFARNTEDHFAIRKILLNYGVSLHSVTEPIGNSPTEKFIETVLAGAAEFDNAIRSQRSIDGMASRIKQGIYPFKPPMGYSCAHHNKQGEKKTIPDKPDKKIFPIIQRGLREYAKAQISQTELCRLFDEWGLSEITGKKIYAQKVNYMLIQYLPFYAGFLINPWAKEGEEKVIKGKHQPMISEEEYHKIIMVRTGKYKNVIRRERNNPEFPLKRTIICGYCGKLLTGSHSRGGGGKYAYYHCYNKDCSYYGKAISKKIIESEFMDYLKTIKPTEAFFDTFKATIIDLWREKGERYDNQASKYEKQLDELVNKKKRIFEMREDNSYTKEEFLKRKEEIENELATTKISLSEARIEQFDIEATIEYATLFLSNIDRQWFDISPKLKTRFQKLLFPKGIPYKKGEGFGTSDLGVIFELNNIYIAQKSNLVGRVRFELTKAKASRFTVCPR